MQLGDSNANCCLPSSLSSLAKREPLVVVDVVVQKYPLFFLLRSYLIFFYWWEWSKIALLFLTRGLLTRREKKGGGVSNKSNSSNWKNQNAHCILHTAYCCTHVPVPVPWTFALNPLACSLMRKLTEMLLKLLMNWVWLYDFSLGE